MKPLSFKCTTIATMLLIIFPAWGQELPGALFNEAEDQLARAREVQAHILSPNNYGQAIDEYCKAAQVYNKEGSIQDIETSIEKLNMLLQTALNNVDIAHATFPQVINARIDAMEAKAPSNQKSVWDDAEAKLNDAARRLEKGDLKNAKEKASKRRNCIAKPSWKLSKPLIW